LREEELIKRCKRYEGGVRRDQFSPRGDRARVVPAKGKKKGCRMDNPWSKGSVQKKKSSYALDVEHWGDPSYLSVRAW